MPLKHSTETVLVVVLAIVMLAAGVLTASLPSLPMGAGPWGIAFLAAVLYPLILYPFLRDNRADNIFRLMHWGPAALLLVWFALAILELVFPMFFVLRRILVWGWSLIAVVALFVMLVAFCLRVLREGGKRVSILASILGVFLALAFVGEWFGWPSMLSRDLWSGKTTTASVTGTGSVAVVSSSSSSAMALSSSSVMSSSSRSSVMSSSSVSSSRSSVMSSQSSAAASSSSTSGGWFSGLISWIFGSGSPSSSSAIAMASSSSSSSSVTVAMSSSSSSSSVAASVSSSSSSRTSSSLTSSSLSSRSSSSLPLIGQSSSSSVPPHLPTSGPGLGELLLLLGAGYTGLLHVRAKKRA